MNSAFLRFRLRQAGKFIREIPVIYLVILTGILLIAGIALYQFTKDLHGSLIIAGILLVFPGQKLSGCTPESNNLLICLQSGIYK